MSFIVRESSRFQNERFYWKMGVTMNDNDETPTNDSMVELWKLINDYTVACGGFSSTAMSTLGNNQRDRLVAAIESWVQREIEKCTSPMWHRINEMEEKFQSINRFEIDRYQELLSRYEMVRETLKLVWETDALAGWAWEDPDDEGSIASKVRETMNTTQERKNG
jgi:hypothetical protein